MLEICIPTMAPKKDFTNYHYDSEAARMAPLTTFCIQDQNQLWGERNLDQLKEKVIVEHRTPDINGHILETLQLIMQRNHYVVLGHDKPQKYWYPSSPDILNAVSTAEKLFGFVCMDPLNANKCLKPITINDIPPNPITRDKFADNRYKRLQRAIEMFILFGVSYHNLGVFRDFLVSQLSYITNLYCLSHNDFNYTAPYLIPISWVSQNPTDFLTNPVVQYYTRTQVSSKRRTYETLADLDQEW